MNTEKTKGKGGSMKNSSPSFQLYASDLLVDTIEWDIDEVGIYTRLLMAQWSNGDLPDDANRLARIAGCSLKRFQKAWGQVSGKFVQKRFQKGDSQPIVDLLPEGEGRLINLRLEETRKKQEEFRKNCSEYGRMGQEKKKSKPVDNSSLPLSQPSSLPLKEPFNQNEALLSSSSIFKDNNKSYTNNIISSQPTSPAKEAFINQESEPDEPDNELRNALQEIQEKKGQRYAHQCILFIQNYHRNGNRKAVIHCILQVVKGMDDIEYPKAYLEAAFKIENGKHNARDFEKEAEGKKGPVTTQGMAVMGQIMAGLGRASP